MASKNINEITTALNQPENLKEFVENFHTLSSRVLKSWATVDKALLDFRNASQNLNVITTHVSKGEGTVGKIMMNDQLYLKLNSLLSKGETIFNDINHYGLFFNMDKGWQRLRARRLNLLTRLSTPQEFRNFLMMSWIRSILHFPEYSLL